MLFAFPDTGKGRTKPWWAVAILPPSPGKRGQIYFPLRYCVSCVAGRSPENAGALARDPDSRDTIALNRSRSVHQCGDVGAYLITSLDLPRPGTMGETL